MIWLTTVGRDGTPQPNPVWFLWEGQDRVLVFNNSRANRLVHVRRRPRVSLNFDGDGQGGDIIVFTGDVEVLEGHPPVTENAAYLEKYRDGIHRVSGTAEAFAQTYSVAARVHITRVRGF